MKPKALFLALFLSLSLFAASWQKVSQNTGSAPTNGLVAYYQCENNVLDTQGAYNGTATNITYSTGKSGQACVFNGTSSNFALTNAIVTGARTLSLWVKTTNSTGQFYLAATTSMSSGNYGWGLGLSSGNAYLASQNNTGNYFATVGSTKQCADGQWHHIAYTWDGSTASNGIVLYVDGVIVGFGTSLVSSWANSYPLQYGSLPSYTTYTLSGSLDSIRIYNRALSAAEVQAIYQAGN